MLGPRSMKGGVNMDADQALIRAALETRKRVIEHLESWWAAKLGGGMIDPVSCDNEMRMALQFLGTRDAEYWTDRNADAMDGLREELAAIDIIKSNRGPGSDARPPTHERG